jgi:hypothetical protein
MATARNIFSFMPTAWVYGAYFVRYEWLKVQRRFHKLYHVAMPRTHWQFGISANFLTCSWRVSSLNLGQTTNASQSFETNSGITLKAGNDRFLSHPRRPVRPHSATTESHSAIRQLEVVRHKAQCVTHVIDCFQPTADLKHFVNCWTWLPVQTGGYPTSLAVNI